MLPKLPGTEHPPISLDILKNFMIELEKSLQNAQLIKDQTQAGVVNHEHLNELAKCVGFLNAISDEANLLLGDVKREKLEASSPVDMKQVKAMEKLMESLGYVAPGTSPTTNNGLGGDIIPFGPRKPRGSN